MDVDDLFGDSEHVNLQNITTVPPVKGLARRVDELGASGCCQKITWSKNGCAAYITPDGAEVHLKVFSRDIETGKWDLGKDVTLDIPQGREHFPFVHLSWSHLGNDLVVVDAAGRVLNFSCAMALDRMTYIKTELAHPEAEAEADGVVGLHWLAIYPYEQKNHIAWSAERDGEKWKWNIRSHVFHDAHHPIPSKASLIYLKRHGELVLRFQQNDNAWQETSTQLGPMISTQESFTHAAFASNNDDTLFMAAYDDKRRLQLYRIEFAWQVPQEKQSQNAGHFDKPGIQVSLIASEENCDPLHMINGDLDGDAEFKGVAPAQLTHLSFLPVTPDQNDGSLPTIQAIYCRPPNLVSMDHMQPQETPHSVIVKWEVQQLQQNQLHPSLDQATSKKKAIGSVTARTIFKLSRAADYPMHAVVLSCIPVWYHMLFAFHYSDGTIEFRKRSTMEILHNDGNTDTVTSLYQAGFAFPHGEPSLHMALSPNFCISACMQQDSTIKLRSLEYQRNTLSITDSDPRNSAALAALILQSASSANQYFSSDDIFSIMPPLSPPLTRSFTVLLFEALQVNIDCGIDDMNNNYLMLLGRSPFFVKTLSAMNLLGLKSPTDRDLRSKMAWIVLNIKYVTQILTSITRMHVHIDKTLLRPEVVPQFIGICRWIMHFIAYLTDALFALGREVENLKEPLTASTLTAIFERTNNPAVLLLLSAFPRHMMKLWSQPLAWVKRSAENFTNAAGPVQSPEVRKLYAPLASALSEIPFDWRWFERLVSETHDSCRTAFKKANLSDTARNAVERDLLMGVLPDVYTPLATALLTTKLSDSTAPGGCLADRLDPGRLYFFDTTWLGFTHSLRGAEWHASHVVDVCQKMVIRGRGTVEHPVTSATLGRARSDSRGSHVGDGAREKKRQLRRCVRCGSYMEDVTVNQPGYAPHHINWLMGIAKHCVCGNSWVLAPEKARAK
ncbi:Mediator of RNA polymerase II transcription subunit 16 [Didymella glomerata]|uniref:Mediator of RNA polymerase II transcription subunit 16 n=1 Tax=Didymella glomerata TaxID=749621 RepID=A0A9W8X7D4_9PLEO|nr:Mediator of RNA polymerase II transcription subunit 16 [Didymella glomerata]